MRAGDRRNQVEIQQRVETGRTLLNDPIFSWQTFREPYVRIEARRGREHFDPGSRQRFGETVFLFAALTDEIVGVTSEMRIVLDGQNYDIRDVRPDLQRRGESIIEATLQGGAVV